MELFQLRYFIKAAEFRSFTRAAEACCVSQPALSQAIQKLEDELRQPLFERGGRQISLSDAGQRFLPRATQIIKLADEARATITDDGETGTLRLSAIPTIAPYWLPRLAKSFASRFPKVQLELGEDITEVALKRCRSGEIDLALLALPLDATDLDVVPLREEELLVALPREHSLATTQAFSIADLEPFPFVLLDEVHCLAGSIVSFCKRHRLQPQTTNRSQQLTTVLELVAHGFGVSFIPQMATERRADPRLVYRSLNDQRPTRQLAMCSNPYRFQSRVLKAMQSLVRDELSEAG